MQGSVDARALLPWFVLSAAIVTFVLFALRARRWRTGRPAPVNFLSGLLVLPKRYLVDVHHIVARDPFAARMHALVAGGLVGGSALLLFGVWPGVAGYGIYWWLVTAAFAVMLVGAAMVRLRRAASVKPKRLSGGRYQLVPVLLLAYALGCLFIAWDDDGEALLDWLAFVLALLGGFGLALQAGNGPLRHALAGALHLIAHPRPGRFQGKRESALRPLDLEESKLGVESPRDFAWNWLLGFDACVQCGRCEEVCPAFAAGQPLNPKQLIQDLVASQMPGGGNADYAGSRHPGSRSVSGVGGPAQAIIGPDAMIHPNTLWACTTCRACVEECPMMIEHVDAVIDLRRFQTLELGAVPPKAEDVLAEFRYADDAAGRDPAARTDFAAGLGVRVIEPGQSVDVLLWLGEGAYDLRYGRSLRALMRLLQKAEVDFAVLGAAERDCGDLARRLGDEITFQRLAKINIATLSGFRFKRIVTADPHALHVLRNEYPVFGGSYEVVHHTSLLTELLEAGALTVTATETRAIAYHDPCYLGRYNGEIDAPRRLLERIGTGRVEMARHGLRSMCCGGGGGAPVSDIVGEHRIADLRMAQASETGATIVAVACPGCTAMLEGVVGARPQVLDIAELLLEAVER
jgi:Fe-S oxidoreductase